MSLNHAGNTFSGYCCTPFFPRNSYNGICSFLFLVNILRTSAPNSYTKTKNVRIKIIIVADLVLSTLFKSLRKDKDGGRVFIPIVSELVSGNISLFVSTSRFRKFTHKLKDKTKSINILRNMPTPFPSKIPRIGVLYSHIPILSSM